MLAEQLRDLAPELGAFIRPLVAGMGRKKRLMFIERYVHGLLLDGERKSIEPIAARLTSHSWEAKSMRTSLKLCISTSEWDEREVFRRIAHELEAGLTAVEALLVDHTEFLKKGESSVGVTHQHSTTQGRRVNCQVAANLHLVGRDGSGCIGTRLYLPDSWAADGERRKATRVPADVVFAETWRIALQLVDEALARGVRRRVVIAGLAYGEVDAFRDALTVRGLPYLVEVPGALTVWPTGDRGAVDDFEPMRVSAAARVQPSAAWRTVAGSDDSPCTSRWLATRVRVSQGRAHQEAEGPQWLLVERDPSKDELPRFFLSTLPADTPLHALAHLARLRWRVDRDNRERRDDLGLDHFEGRSWTGFHHHAALVAAAHAFLTLRRVSGAAS